MNPVRKKKLITVLFTVFVLGMVTMLVMYALRQNISLFYTPTQVVRGDAAHAERIRLGGMVVKGSVIRASHDLSVQFELTDFNKTVTVNYRGILPDLFREGQGIVATGAMLDNQHFNAVEVLAKHDEKYMPPEVKDALANVSQSQNEVGR